MLYQLPYKVDSTYDGYKMFIDLHSKANELSLDDVTLDFSKTTWFEANLTAALGAILNNIMKDLNSVNIVNLQKSVESIFQKNHFLSHFGGYKIPDYYESTIKYRKFKTTEEKLFKEYLDNELLSKKAMPSMSIKLRKKINESIFEIFNNAVIHADCKNIFSCGQYFPQKNKLDFTLVDLGATIKENVNSYLGKKLSGEDAIEWAIIEGNTTKRGKIPGGLGLSLIIEFLKKNGGKIQIISADGFWEQTKNKSIKKSFDQEFQGTIVNLEFNMADTSRYCLMSEIKPDEIF